MSEQFTSCEPITSYKPITSGEPIISRVNQSPIVNPTFFNLQHNLGYVSFGQHLVHAHTKCGKNVGFTIGDWFTLEIIGSPEVIGL